MHRRLRTNQLCHPCSLPAKPNKNRPRHQGLLGTEVWALYFLFESDGEGWGRHECMMSSPYDINTCHDRKSILRPWLVVNNYVVVIKKAERNICTLWFSVIASYSHTDDQHSWNRDCRLWRLGFFPYIPAIGLPNETCRY